MPNQLFLTIYSFVHTFSQNKGDIFPQTYNCKLTFSCPAFLKLPVLKEKSVKFLKRDALSARGKSIRKKNPEILIKHTKKFRQNKTQPEFKNLPDFLSELDVNFMQKLSIFPWYFSRNTTSNSRRRACRLVCC